MRDDEPTLRDTDRVPGPVDAEAADAQRVELRKQRAKVSRRLLTTLIDEVQGLRSDYRGNFTVLGRIDNRLAVIVDKVEAAEAAALKAVAIAEAADKKASSNSERIRKFFESRCKGCPSREVA